MRKPLLGTGHWDRAQLRAESHVTSWGLPCVLSFRAQTRPGPSSPTPSARVTWEFALTTGSGEQTASRVRQISALFTDAERVNRGSLLSAGCVTRTRLKISQRELPEMGPGTVETG